MKSSDKEFIAEAEEILQESGKLLLEIQDTFKTGANPDTVNALFRALHTLKGLSGLFGLTVVTDISHALESILDDIRLGKAEITEESIRFLFKYVDVLRNITEGLDSNVEIDATAYLADIKSFRKSLESKGATDNIEGLIDKSILRVLSDYEEHRLKTNIKEGKGIYLCKTVFNITDFDVHLETVTKTIKTVGELVSTLPTSQNLPPDSLGFNLLFGSQKFPEELAETIKYEIVELVPCKGQRPLSQAQQAQPADKGAATISTLKTATTTVRVDIEKLDRILNTVGELTLAKGAVHRISKELTETYGHTALAIDMHKISQTFDRRLAELQDQVLEIRMVPIGQIFSRLSQVIRRYTREVGKHIELVMYGEDTELDKFVAEEIVDPLVHIVRNAIDHGIESVEERELKGKKDVATVVLKAFQRGNHVVIEVKDDGSGIDLEKVRLKGIKKGLIDPNVEYQKRELIDLLFMPGFSTKDVVSDMSGRGVGLDIVHERLALLGGFSDVETERDKGTKFTLTLPITLAIIKSLIVRVGDFRFAIPLTSISETLVLEHKSLKTIENKDVFNLRGAMLPMTSLKELFGLEGDVSERSFAVLVGYGERRVGLMVDEMLGQQEIVIKSLGDYLKGVRGFAGAAEIGKHEVILVLDIEAAIEESLLRQKIAVHV